MEPEAPGANPGLGTARSWVGTATNFLVGKMGIIIEPTSKAVLRIEDMHVKPLEEPWYWLTL